MLRQRFSYADIVEGAPSGPDYDKFEFLSICYSHDCISLYYLLREAAEYHIHRSLCTAWEWSFIYSQTTKRQKQFPLACFCRLFPSGIVYISLTASNPVRIHHKPALIGRRKNISFEIETSLHIFFDRIYLLFFNHICKILPGALQRTTRFRGI